MPDENTPLIDNEQPDSASEEKKEEADSLRQRSFAQQTAAFTSLRHRFRKIKEPAKKRGRLCIVANVISASALVASSVAMYNDPGPTEFSPGLNGKAILFFLALMTGAATVFTGCMSLLYCLNNSPCCHGESNEFDREVRTNPLYPEVKEDILSVTHAAGIAVTNPENPYDLEEGLKTAENKITRDHACRSAFLFGSHKKNNKSPLPGFFNELGSVENKSMGGNRLLQEIFEYADMTGASVKENKPGF